MYGALELPMIWLYAWFSMTTTTTWPGAGTPPVACAVSPVLAQTPAAAAPRPRADARAASMRRVGRGITGTSGQGGAGAGAAPRQSVSPRRAPRWRRPVNRRRTFGYRWREP